MTTRTTRPPQDAQIFVFNNVEPSHLMVPIPETHRNRSSSLWISRACRASLVYFIWIPNFWRTGLFAHQSRLSSIAESSSGVLLLWLCQGAVPRRPARQFPVSARSTPSLQNKFNYGWFCVSDLQDPQKSHAKNHSKSSWVCLNWILSDDIFVLDQKLLCLLLRYGYN